MKSCSCFLLVFFLFTDPRSDSAGAFWRPSLALLLIVSWQKEEILGKESGPCLTNFTYAFNLNSVLPLRFFATGIFRISLDFRAKFHWVAGSTRIYEFRLRTSKKYQWESSLDGFQPELVAES